jgi:hypothetical protein
VEPGGGAQQLTSPLPLDLLLAQQETSGRDTRPLVHIPKLPCVLESLKGSIIASRLRIRITLMRIQIQHFPLMRIRILLLIKVMRSSDHWSTGPPGLNFEPLGLHLWASMALHDTI